MYKVDLNSDLGESFGTYTIGSDDRVLALVSSANVACGFHAGDPSVMGATVAACRAQGVAVGAHPGFPDLVGFGRRQLAMTPIWRQPASPTSKMGQGRGLRIQKSKKSKACAFGKMQRLAWAYPAHMPEVWPCSLPALISARTSRGAQSL